MKNSIKLTSFLAVMACLLFLTAGCFEKDDPEPDFCMNWDKELEEANRELTNFAQNPTQSTCTSLKRNQLDLLNKLKGCQHADQTQVQQLISFWNEYDCNIFN